MSQVVDENISAFKVRPRFQVETTYSVEALSLVIKEELEKENSPCKGLVYGDHARLYMPRQEQHYWSPQLALNFDDTEAGSLIRGTYGPHPSVWTMFVFFYSLIGFAIMVIIMIGLSYLSLGQPATILWLAPILALVFFSLYLVSYFGQKLGHDQIEVLHRFLEKCIGKEI